jgi:hypothetical protein
MAYKPEERISRMKELMKPIDQQIMMCDDEQDLLAFASIMATTAKGIFVSSLGVEGAREVLKILVEKTNG